MKRLASLTLLCALLLPGQAFSGGPSVQVGPNANPFTFSPEDTALPSTGTVFFDWISGSHNLTFVDESIADVPTTSNGDTFRTFTRVGTFDFYCSLHGAPGTGMHGSVAVAGVRGRVFHDLNGDGNTDPGEPGRAGVFVTIDAGPTQVSTDSNGYWQFINVPNGNRTITMTPPADWANTGTNPITLNYAAGSVSDTHEFHTAPIGEISGTVRRDLEPDGTGDTPAPAGTTVWLDREPNPDGIRDSDEPFTTTDSSGAYSFENLEFGTYWVQFNPPYGGDRTAPDPLGQTLNSGTSSATGKDVNYVMPGTSSIGGTIVEDLNGDGNADPGEPGLAGVEVRLNYQSGVAPDATIDDNETTDANGNYVFTGIGKGTYTVDYVLPASATATSVRPRTIGLTSGFPSAGEEDFFVRRSNRSISGTVFKDTDGVLDGAEGPQAGIRVFIDSNGNGAFDAGEPNRVPGDSGTYAFANLVPGTYTVAVAVPDGFQSTGPAARSVSVVTATASAGNDFWIKSVPILEQPPTTLPPLTEPPPDDPDAPDLVFETTRNGTAASDRMNGTSANDRIDGKAGDDTIFGLGGSDVLFGSAGRDTLRGGTGADTLFGGIGNDVLDGGSDKDVLNGGPGNDNLKGGTGDDRVNGQGGNDRLDGGRGRDQLNGGAGRDTIAAADGQRDTVRCGAGRDSARVDGFDRVSGCESVRRS